MYNSKSRQIKLQETKDLLYRHTEEITKDAAHWMNFLDTASRLYRYQFSHVVLIHAQRPGASAVAPYDVWSKNMRRYIKRGTKGIALIDDLWSDPHMRYVYDIADTGMTRMSHAPANWEITDENEEAMREHMIATYGLEPALSDTLDRALLQTTFQVCESRERDIIEVMHNRDAAEDGSLMRNVNEEMLDGQIAELLTYSLAYILMRRCGLDPMSVVSENDFTRVLKGIENFELLDAVGAVMMEQAGLVLHDMYRTSVQIANEKVKNTVDSINKMDYTTINKALPYSAASKPAVDTPAALQSRSVEENNGKGGLEHGHSVHSQGGLSVSQSDRDAGSGRENRNREIWDDAHGVSPGTSERNVSESSVHGESQEALRESERRGDGTDGIPDGGADGALQRSGSGSDDGRLELYGVEEYNREDGGGDRPGGLSVHVVEPTAEIEDDGLTPEEPDEISPGLTLPELPSMEEQIRELQSLEEASFSAESSVPVEVIDEFLRFGGPKDKSKLRIIYNFMISQTDEEYTEFIRKEFAGRHHDHYETYRGTQIDGIPYTAEWSEDGFTVAAGRSIDSIGKTRLTWGDVSRRIEQLLLAGQYAPQELLDQARDNAIREHAQTLRTYFLDISGEARSLFTHVDTGLFQGNYSEDPSAQLREEIVKPVFLKNLLIDLQAVQKYAEDNPDNIWARGQRWKFWRTRPAQITSLFLKFQKPAIPYREAPNFQWKDTKSFIPQEVLDRELRGNATSGHSYRVFSFFLTHKGKEERADFLKHAYGTGGHSGPDFYSTDYDANGILIRIGYTKQDSILCSWPKAAERVARLMDQGRYLNEDQFQKLASYELNTMAERVARFYQMLPGDIAADYRPAKIGNYVWETPPAGEAAKSMDYAGMLSDAERSEALYRDMMQAFAALPADNRNYERAEETVQNIRLYIDGKYTLFPGMERVQSSDVITNENAAISTLEERAENESDELGTEKAQAGASSAERKNLSAPEERDDGSKAPGDQGAEASQTEASPSSGGQNTVIVDNTESSFSIFAGQQEKMEKRSRRSPKRKKKRDLTESMRTYHGFPDSVSNGQGQQMSLFDFMSSDGGGFDAMKFVPDVQTDAGTLQDVPRGETETSEAQDPVTEPAEESGESDIKPETSEAGVKEAQNPEERNREEETTEGSLADEATSEATQPGNPDDELVAEDATVSETDYGETALPEENTAEKPAGVLTEEEEDLAFAADLTPGETAFVTAQTHYLIREINFADRIVSAQDMDYAVSAGKQIYQTFTFHEVRAIFDLMQNMEPEIAESTETEPTEEPVETSEPQFEVVARYQSTSAMQDGYVENIAILRYLNYGKFYNHYGYDEERGTGTATAGPFDTLEDARQTVLAHRPDAVEIFRAETIERSSGISDEPESEEEPAETDDEKELSADIPGQEAFIQERINYKITDDALGEGGPKEKFRRNLAAIQTLKQIESENRLATAEEQEILAQYVGWGGLSQAFLSSTDLAAGKTSTDGAWANEQQLLLDALTPQEYDDARESTLTSFYTPPVVIRAMYQALSNFGFTSGNVLEPSCGIGNFMGLVPDTMDASMYGVELDSISGRIAQQLYQQNQILVQGFETAKYPDNFFDVVIGNVPFGDFPVSDPRYQRNHFSIHEYFIAKSLDLVRPGGIVAVVTSSYTMDKKDSAVRRYIANRADLLGAIRLPNNTFAKNAGTTVVSDILFLQKRDRAVIEEPLWVENPTGDFNPYFRVHSSMVLGRIEEVSGRFGMQETVLPYENESLENLLDLVIPLIDGRIPDVDVDETAEMEGVDFSVPAYPDVRNYSYAVVDGKIYYREDSRMNPVDVPKNTQGRMKDMIELSFLVRDLLHAQMDESREGEILPLQRQLNDQYDAFVESWGRISSPVNRKAFQNDSSYSLLASLEILDDEGNFDHKADIFTKRTISRAVPVTHVDTASEALAVCIGELARVDLGRMSELTGKTEEEVERELSGVIFRDVVCSETPSDAPQAFPSLDSFSVVTSDEYLSGNVRSKLRMARAYQKAIGSRASDEDRQRIATSIAALESVQPEDLKASEIQVRIGTTWIPLEYYNDFLYETFNIPHWLHRSIFVEYSEQTGAWFIRGKTRVDDNNTDVYQMYGTNRASGLRLYEDALNLRSTKIYDTVQDEDGKQKRVLNSKQTVLAQQKQELLCEHFKDWIYNDISRRERLEQIYNEKFNNTRPREYDGSHITFAGMSPEIHLMEHQRNAVAHILYGKNTLLAHCVGAGKTYEMVAAGMECRRLGLAKKCMYVVPNHLTEQWATEFLTLYPAANILAATKKDFEPANRKKFCSRIATGDYDAIIIGHSQFEKIPLSPERQASILKKQIKDITDAIAAERAKSGKGDFTVKQMEKTKKTLQSRLDKLNNQSKKDRVVTFEELGVDRLFVDESHNYKNLFLYTKMTNVAGISQTDAQKSSDMFAKCQYLDEITGGRGVVFATGTPISNSAVELYTLMRYLQYGTLEKMNMTNFDSWASTFGETVNAIELAPEGTGYRTKTRFAHFYNLPELTSVFREAADVKTADMLNLPVPEAEYINETIKPSEIQKEMVDSFGKRADMVRGGSVNPREDNMLKITNDGRKCALDERLISDMLPDEEESKVNRCVSNAFEVWQETAENRSTQLIFCDLSTPKGDGTFNVYDDIRDKLVGKGIPKEEIAFIHEYNTEVKKAELFKKVRSGVIRILMGSTQKMGAGTNVQDRLIALHHLDCPWKPSDLEQQEGRILRQGNRNKKVKIFRYVTEGTFDSYMWQLLENKQKFISQIMTSKCPARSMQDVDDAALTYAEIKMLAAGDSKIKEKMTLDVEVSKLKVAKSNYMSQKYDLETKVAVTYPQTIQALKERIEGLGKDAVEAKRILELEKSDVEGAFQMQIGSIVYTNAKEAGQGLVSRCKQLKGLAGNVRIGTYHGFEMYAAFLFGTTFDARLTLKGGTSTEIKLSSDPVGNITRIHNALGKFDERIEESERKLAETESMLEAAKKNLGKPFELEEELQRKLARLNELDAELNINKSSSVDAIGVDEDVDTFTAGDGSVQEEPDDEYDEYDAYDQPSYGSANRKICRFGN